MRKVVTKSKKGKVYGPYYYDDMGNKAGGGGVTSTLSKIYTATSLLRGTVSNVRGTISGSNDILRGIPELGRRIKKTNKAFRDTKNFYSRVYKAKKEHGILFKKLKKRSQMKGKSKATKGNFNLSVKKYNI